MRLVLELHSLAHESLSEAAGPVTAEDEVWNHLTREMFITMPTPKDNTIAWDIWHITRIEDITVNFLIAGGEQLLDENQLKSIGSPFCDTGNSWTDEEIVLFSRSVDSDALRRYRKAVGTGTREVISRLTFEDMKRKPQKSDLQKIRESGAVTDQPDSAWLTDFWGRKDVAGLLLMPVTRHQMVHLNECLKLKAKIGRRKTAE